MFTVIICSIVFILLLIFAAVCFLVGILVGQRIITEPEKKVVVRRQPDSAELRKAERTKKEIANMLSYNGEPQEELTD